LRPHAPSQKSRFWVRPQAHSGAGLAQRPLGPYHPSSRDRRGRTIEVERCGHGRRAGDRAVSPGVPGVEHLVQSRFDRGVETTAVIEDSATITLTHHDPVTQRITKQYVTLSGRPVGLLPVAQRYCWPSELDLMAQLAGLRLRERYGDWTRTGFDASSRAHVSVYELI
jgi:hypothetical protein